MKAARHGANLEDRVAVGAQRWRHGSSTTEAERSRHVRRGLVAASGGVAISTTIPGLVKQDPASYDAAASFPSSSAFPLMCAVAAA